MYISFSSRPARDAGSAPDGATSRRGRKTVSSTVVTLGVVSLLTDISSESITAVLPLYVTGYLGMSTIAFGFIDGLYQGVSALVRIAGGYTSDRLDRPKWVAFAGYGMAALARVGLLFATGFGALIAVISADRIGKGIRTAPRDALITVSSRPENLGAAFGTHRMLDNVGAALGPLLAFLILLLIPDGYGTIFVASLGFAVIGVTILGLLVPDVRRRARPADGTHPARTRFAWRAVTAGPMRRALAAAGVFGLLTIGDGFVYLLLQTRAGFGAQWFPLLYVGTNVAFIALAIPLGRLADRIGRARVFVYGHAVLLAAYLIAALPMTGAVPIMLCLLCLGAFYAATDGVLAALAGQLSTADTLGTGIAAAQTVTALARFVSAAGFGVLWYLLGAEASMFLISGLLVVAIPVVMMLLRPLLIAPTPAEADT